MPARTDFSDSLGGAGDGPGTKNLPKRSRHTPKGGAPGTKRADNRGRSLPTAVDLLRKVPQNVAGAPPEKSRMWNN